jgi:HK97 family phage prohead protease
MERLFFNERVGLEFRSGSGDAATIVGYAAVFNSPSEELPVRSDEPNGRKFREIVRPGAFAESLTGQRSIVALFQHNPLAVLGSTQAGTLRLSEDHRGLRYEITPPNTGAGRDVVELIRRGDVRASSFGFKVRPGGQTVKRDGGQIVRELRSVQLLDVSPVTTGAYSAASVSLRSLDPAFCEMVRSLDTPGDGLRWMRLALAEAEG